MNPKNQNLTDLPNIGEVLAHKLQIVEIDTIQKLKSSGTENCFLKLHTIDSDACLSMLYAIEGAIEGVRWHSIDKERKEELKEFFDRVASSKF